MEIPMFESVVSFGLVEHVQGAIFDPPVSPMGYRRAVMPARRPFPTLDGNLCVMPYSDAHWNSLLDALKDVDARRDPRFSTLANRSQHIEALYERLADHLRTRTTADALALCQSLDVPAARMNRLEELKDDPHLRAVNHFVRVQDERMGTLVFPANPVTIDGKRATLSVPPRLGEHTDAVLSEAGLGTQR